MYNEYTRVQKKVLGTMVNIIEKMVYGAMASFDNDTQYTKITDVCNHYHKEFKHWRVQLSVNEYLLKLSTSLGVSIDELIVINYKGFRGTWTHPIITQKYIEWLKENEIILTNQGKLYVMCDINNNAYKIGFTINFVSRRKTHKTSNPFLKMIKTYEDVTKNFEALVHHSLRNYRIKNTIEWYNMSDEIIPIIDELYQDRDNKTKTFIGERFVKNKTRLTESLKKVYLPTITENQITFFVLPNQEKYVSIKNYSDSIGIARSTLWGRIKKLKKVAINGNNDLLKIEGDELLKVFMAWGKSHSSMILVPPIVYQNWLKTDCK